MQESAGRGQLMVSLSNQKNSQINSLRFEKTNGARWAGEHLAWEEPRDTISELDNGIPQ